MECHSVDLWTALLIVNGEQSLCKSKARRLLYALLYVRNAAYLACKTDLADGDKCIGYFFVGQRGYKSHCNSKVTRRFIYFKSSDDIEVNVCKEKHLTAIRSSGADEKLTLITPVQLSLEEAIEFITDEELIEVTPKSIRLRKVILDTPSRKRIQAQKRAALKNDK